MLLFPAAGCTFLRLLVLLLKVLAVLLFPAAGCIAYCYRYGCK
jgi:hypothetical protein